MLRGIIPKVMDLEHSILDCKHMNNEPSVILTPHNEAMPLGHSVVAAACSAPPTGGRTIVYKFNTKSVHIVAQYDLNKKLH